MFDGIITSFKKKLLLLISAAIIPDNESCGYAGDSTIDSAPSRTIRRYFSRIFFSRRFRTVFLKSTEERSEIFVPFAAAAAAGKRSGRGRRHTRNRGTPDRRVACRTCVRVCMCGTVTPGAAVRIASRNVSAAAAADPKRRTTSSHDPSTSPPARSLPPALPTARRRRDTADRTTRRVYVRACVAVHKSLLGVPAAFLSHPPDHTLTRSVARTPPSPRSGAHRYAHTYIRVHA